MESPSFHQRPDGRKMVCAPFGAQALPPVGISDLGKAWEVASMAAEDGLVTEDTDPEGVVFKDKYGDAIQLEFDDFDALCWATAINRSYGLTTVKGLSLCLRMLALYQVMAESPWALTFFTFDRKNRLKIDKALMAAAAVTQLTADGRFDADGIQRETGAHQIAPP